MAQAQSSKCKNCLNAEGTFFCYNCKQYLCLQCKSFHDNFTKGHSVVDSNNVDIAVFGTNVTCKGHNLEFSYQCIGCDCLICASCVIEEHKTHEYKPIKEIATDKRLELRAQKNEVALQKNLMSEMKAKVVEELYPELKANEGKLSTGLKTVQDEIKDIFLEESKNIRRKMITTDEQEVKRCISNIDTKQKECTLRIKEINKLESIKHDPTFLEIYKPIRWNENGAEITTQLPEINDLEDIDMAKLSFVEAFIERLDSKYSNMIGDLRKRLDTCHEELKEHCERVKYLESCLNKNRIAKRNSDMKEEKEDLLSKYLVLERTLDKEPISKGIFTAVVAIYIGNRSSCVVSLKYKPKHMFNCNGHLRPQPAMFCLDEQSGLVSFGIDKNQYWKTEQNRYCFPTIETLKKMKLDEDLIVDDIEGKRLPAKDLMSLIIQHHTTQVMTQVKMTELYLKDILWVLTGPLMSKDSENFIKEAALSAGIPEENLCLCPDIEAIPRHPDLLPRRRECTACVDDFIVISFGDFTDVFVYSRDSENDLHKVQKYHMETVGMKIVVDFIIDLMKEITGDRNFSEFESIEAFDRVQEIKGRLRRLTCNSMPLTFKLHLLVSEKENKDASKFVNEAFEKGEIRFVGDKVRIQKSILEPTLKKQSELFVSFLTDLFGNSNVSTVYIFGDNKLLESTFTENFPKMKTLVINDDVEISKSKGAVCYGYR